MSTLGIYFYFTLVVYKRLSPVGLQGFFSVSVMFVHVAGRKTIRIGWPFNIKKEI